MTELAKTIGISSGTNISVNKQSNLQLTFIPVSKQMLLICDVILPYSDLKNFIFPTRQHSTDC